MARISQLNDAQRALVARLRDSKASDFERGQLDALRSSIADPVDVQLIDMAIARQESA